MTAKQALGATLSAHARGERERKNQAVLNAEQRRKDDEWSRKIAYPRFMRDVVRKTIVEATSDEKEWARASTTNKIVAELVVGKLCSEGYQSHVKEVHIPEERSYGDSGEGMHDAYWLYVIHIAWGQKSRCPACDEDYQSSRR